MHDFYVEDQDIVTDPSHRKVHLDLILPGSKRFVRSLDLFGPIDAAASSFQFFGTKVR